MSRVSAHIFPAVGTAVLMLLVSLWVPCRDSPLYLSMYRNSGKPMVIGVGWGRVYLIYSNVPLGTDRAWSASLRWVKGDEAYSDNSRLEFAPEVKRFFGFRIALAEGMAYQFYFSFVAIPIWAICLPLAWISQRWIRRTLRQRHRICRGLCLHCGYDRRGTPDRCPECGNPSRGPLGRGSFDLSCNSRTPDAPRPEGSRL